MSSELNQEALEEQQIHEAFRHLLDTYLASCHRKKVDLITRAFNFAKHAHKGVRRRSGEPYIMHPIAVAQIACEEIGLGSTSICAALLHDVVEDTEYTFEDIQNLFGPKIASIVEGLTKIAGGIFGERASLQAETFKKLLLTMSEDIRVILIKISDRLHNMRTLSSMLPSKQYKIAGETLYIYAPLADRLGLNKIKTELEDLSFRYEPPDDYDQLCAKLSATQNEREQVFKEFTEPIRQALDHMGLQYQITARIKTPYSIWKKMQIKHVAFEDIFDILATRIIFTPKPDEDEVNTCFNIYVALTRIYKLHPDRTRDWVNHPKANGYQALHLTLMANSGNWIEVQIRSQRMQDIAEHGLAAHWKYKAQSNQADPASQTDDEKQLEMDSWLHTIKEILDDPQPNSIDLLDTIKLNLFASEIIVFTPKGEIKTMPSGATVLDLAFLVHTLIGTHCIGAKVNHKLVPPTYQLNSGDQVEVLTARTPQITHQWLDFVTTAKAKSKIQATLRKMDREREGEGERLLRDFLITNNLEYNPTNLDRLRVFHQRSTESRFLLDIVDGTIVLGDDDVDYLRGRYKKNNRHTWRSLIPFVKSGSNGDNTTDTGNGTATGGSDVGPSIIDTIDKKKVFPINEQSIAYCTIATCCGPIPGDDALGYIDPQARTFTIHKRDCEQANKLKTQHGNNLVAVRWDMHRDHLFETQIHVDGIDKVGTLFQIAESLSKKHGLNVKGLNIKTDAGLFAADLTILVHDTREVNDICQDLMKIETILKAIRI